MDTLHQGNSNPTNGFDYNHHPSIPPILDHNYNLNQHNNSTDPSEASPGSGTSSTQSDNSPEDGDFTDATLKYLSQMLDEEEDLEYKPCMFHQCLALQAAEKSLSDLLDNNNNNNDPPAPTTNPLLVDNQNQESPDDDDDFTRSFSSRNDDNFVKSNWIRDQGEFDSCFGQSEYNYEPFLQYNFQSFGSSNRFHDVAVDGSMAALVSPFQFSNSSLSSVNYANSGGVIEPEENGRRDNSMNGSRGKKNHYREEDGDDYYLEEVRGRSNKQLASSTYYDAHESEDSQMFDKVLLCAELNPHLHGEPEPEPDPEKLKQSKSSPVGRPWGKKQQGNKKEIVDLRTLLTQCAQAVSNSDTRTANDLLNRIRRHSSPHGGDGTERLAYYFANALEARLAGTGMSLYTASKRISAAEILKAYQVYISACPFKIMSYFYANRSIVKLAKNSTKLHIIDFGILYGFQWPCLIQRLSVRPGGPPKLQITGIDFPQPGFRPAERVEDTGRRLASYCKRFNVPFRYNAIAKKWHTIELEDLKIDKDEVVVVNCLYRLKNVPDDTVSTKSPRDAVLNLIKRINPSMFIHGVVNGTFNAPFFVTRFREALFYFSSLFDMFDANAPHEDEQRLLFEEEVFGTDIMSVVACEGTERVERPETYKQWQMRNVRAGLKQVTLNREILDDVRKKVKLDYHREFVVDKDSQWMLQGWKGRIICALSCWKPVQEL